MTKTAIAVVPPEPESIVALFERLATDPNASVEKIERLMALWERGQAQRAEQSFNAAMSATQADVKAVARDATNPQTHSRYASYEALDRALRPIYTANGFALSFNTGEAPGADIVRIVCKVTHLGGHAEVYKLDMPADGKGARGSDVMTKTHATASALSYGMRYLLRMIFNVALSESDDDGNKAAGASSQPQERKSAPDKAEAKGSDEVISEAQRKRFFVILKQTGRKPEEVKDWLRTRFGYLSSAQIKRDRYKFICECLEAPGDLPPYAWSKAEPKP